MTINPNLQTTHDELSVASQGMRSPTVVCLPAGEVIFRFASTKRQTTGESIPSDQWARGAWWIREADYKVIIERFKTGHLSLGTVARSAAAVQPSWSNMDVSIKAYLLDDINVYVGRGSTQYRDVLPNGMCMTLPGWPDIEQIYIPGMGRNGSTFRSIKVQRQKVISTDNFGF